ncbi:polyprenyl synthetase family protein [bacterium]|nr:polyprenyl synthetase family protein [bacterium]
MDEYLIKAFDKYTSIIDEWLDKILPEENEFPQTIHRAMRYSVFAGGKRLRPIFAIEAFNWVGGSGEKIFIPACAVELIHTYSLIHDDLPAMDDDDYRRKKLTCHKVFGEAIAILAGDSLSALAFEILAKTTDSKIIGEVARAIGTQGLVGGQVADIEMEGKPVDENDVKFIHEKKTAALFVASIKLGAMIGNGSSSEISSLTEYARNFGLAFQITDDILDIKGDQKKLGKDIGSDFELDKATYPRAIGLERSNEIAKRLIENAKKALPINKDNKLFLSLADFVLERTF